MASSSNNSVLKPFQLLEVNIISAQDLARVCRNMRTYAVAWIHTDRKLSTRVDTDSHTDPTWNDKFVFRVDEDFLRSDTSAVMVEIYTQHWFRDIHVGTVRVMVGNVIPPRAVRGINQPPKSHRHVGMRFVALQVRRPSGRAQGILNIGVTVLDSSMQSMPLYNQLGSAVGYRDIMGASPSNVEESNVNYYNAENIPAFVGSLRRTRSDSSSMVSRQKIMQDNDKAGSVVGGSVVGGSMVSGSQPKKRKGGSVINGSYFTENVKKSKGGSVINGSETIDKEKTRGAASSIILGSEVGGPQKRGQNNQKYGSNVGKPYMTESELGPSPSEVAAAFVHRRPAEGGSAILGAWNLDQSEEGLRSKLERWRAELQPMFDRGSEYSGINNKNPRVGDRERGSFSCFGNICGIQCTIVCGGNVSQSGRKRDGSSRRHKRSFSDDLSYVRSDLT